MTIIYSFEYCNREIYDVSKNFLLVDPSIQIPGNLFTWDFDVLKIQDNKTLCNIVGLLFDSLVNIINLEKIHKPLLAKYILEVSLNYNETNPFHNFQHAVCVVHITYMIIIDTKIYCNFKPNIIFGILLSALVHDIKHPGHTNSYEINSQSELSLLHKNVSVLENFHWSTSFELFCKINILEESFSEKHEIMEIYRTIKGCILSTDLSLHNDLINAINNKNGIFNLDSSIKDQYLLAKLIIHSADLSNQTREFDISYKWTMRLYNEFKNQIVKEEYRNIESAPFMKFYDDIKKISINEILFIENIIKPVWQILCNLYPCLNIRLDFINNNIENWKYIIENINENDKSI